MDNNNGEEEVDDDNNKEVEDNDDHKEEEEEVEEVEEGVKSLLDLGDGSLLTEDWTNSTVTEEVCLDRKTLNFEVRADAPTW